MSKFESRLPFRREDFHGRNFYGKCTATLKKCKIFPQKSILIKLQNYFSLTLSKLFLNRIQTKIYRKNMLVQSRKHSHFCSYKFTLWIFLLPMIGKSKKADLNEFIKEFNNHFYYYRDVHSPSNFIPSWLLCYTQKMCFSVSDHKGQF